MIWEFGSGRGCAFWLMNEPVGGEEVCFHPTYRLHSVHVRGQGASLASMLPMLSQELQAVQCQSWWESELVSSHGAWRGVARATLAQ